MGKKSYTKHSTLVLLIVCAFSASVLGQVKNPALQKAMEKFERAILTKNPTGVLSFISRAKGLIMMNTIDQGDAGNADKPAFDSKIKYGMLAADFRKKGENYRNFFTVSDVAPSLFDNFSGSKGKWRLGLDEKFMPLENEEMQKGLFVKWIKEGGQWKVSEIGRPIS